MRITRRIAEAEMIPLLTTKDVAAKLGIKRSDVYPLCYKLNGLRAYKVGNQLRFKPEEVEEYMHRPDPKEQTEPPQQPTCSGDLSNLIVGIKFS